jgi:23S rRNA (cytosine1962-C5)-methyltransferase
MLNPGGYLITFSCSGNMTADLFLEMLKNVSRKAKKQVQLIEYRMQTKDHPMLLANMETLYLKCAVIRVCE